MLSSRMDMPPPTAPPNVSSVTASPEVLKLNLLFTLTLLTCKMKHRAAVALYNYEHTDISWYLKQNVGTSQFQTASVEQGVFLVIK